MGHLSQTVCPGIAWKRPFAHAVHSDAPLALIRPAVQFAQDSVPIALAYVPDEQLSQSVAPSFRWDVPVGHGVQLVFEALLLAEVKKPAPHLRHETCACPG